MSMRGTHRRGRPIKRSAILDAGSEKTALGRWDSSDQLTAVLDFSATRSDTGAARNAGMPAKGPWRRSAETGARRSPER